MRAVVLATGHLLGAAPALEPGMQEFARQEPSVLLPVAGRPFLHFVVERLVDAGIANIDFILSESPEKVEESLGDGTRWGVTFRYHLARERARAYGRLAILGIGDDEHTVLAHGDQLPLWEFDVTKPVPELVVRDGKWTGWGLLTGSMLRRITDDLDEAGLFEMLSGMLSARASTPARAAPVREAHLLLSVRTFENLLEANWAVIEKRFPKLLLGTREAADGIWISRNVSLHPTAQLSAPVYIGENCRINAGVQLGPRVVIGNNCLVDRSSVISETVVFAGSYIGQSLELASAIVNRNRLVSVKAGAAITVADNFILGSFVERNLRQFIRRAVSRITAGLLLALTSPLLAISWIWFKIARQGPALCRKAVVRLPAADGPGYQTYDLMSFCGAGLQGAGSGASGGAGSRGRRAHHTTGRAHEFFAHFLPGLINVARGHLALVGVAPRGGEEIDALPRDWRQLYLGSTGGLITEAYVVHGPAPPEDLLYSAEVFYSATTSPRHDAGLMAGYIARLLGLKRWPAPLEAPAELEE